MTVRIYRLPYGEFEEYEYIAEFKNGSFTFGGDEFSYLSGDQLTEERLLEMFDGPRKFAVDPDADSNRLQPDAYTDIGLGHHEDA